MKCCEKFGLTCNQGRECPIRQVMAEERAWDAGLAVFIIACVAAVLWVVL